MQDAYRFSSLRSGITHTTGLSWLWEVNGTPMSDEFTPDEVDAVELLRLWIERCYPDPGAEQRHGPGMVLISWFIAGADKTIEIAPFQARDHGMGDFLTAFTWPVHTGTGQPVNWLSLPVADGQWNSHRADKGGFLHQATGWKPAPLQPVVHLPGLLAAVPGLDELLRAQP
jgi:hypothetical protein